MTEGKDKKIEKKSGGLPPTRRDHAKEALEDVKGRRDRDAAIRDTHKPPDPKKGDK